MDKYEVLLDVQRKMCYTCEKNGNCNALETGACDYKVSKEAKNVIKRAKPLWGRK